MKSQILFVVFLYFLFTSEASPTKGRIINGEDAEYYPYVTMVTGYNDHYGSFGGGSFITLRHVLTAASLIDGMTWWYVDYGKNHLGGLYYESATGTAHPEYNKETFANDIGVLQLLNPADSSESMNKMRKMKRDI